MDTSQEITVRVGEREEYVLLGNWKMSIGGVEGVEKFTDHVRFIPYVRVICIIQEAMQEKMPEGQPCGICGIGYREHGIVSTHPFRSPGFVSKEFSSDEFVGLEHHNID